MSISERTYPADAVVRLFRDTGVSVDAASLALALDEHEVQNFLEHGGPRWFFLAVIGVGLANGHVSESEAARIASFLTPDGETSSR